MNRYSINLNYFCRPLSKEAYYFLGFMCADGNINKGCIRLRLQERDRDILESLRNSIDYTGPLLFEKRNTLGDLVKHCNCQDRYGLIFHSPKIASDLQLLGFRDYEKILSTIPDKRLNHFLRGLFDGDGTVSLYFVDGRPRFEIHLIGDEFLTRSVQKTLEKVGIKNSSIVGNGHVTNNKRLVIRGIQNAKTYFDFIYTGDTISLKRKKNKFIQLMEIH